MIIIRKIEIIIGILLVLIAYFVGKKINEQRKKRANELTDNYDKYILNLVQNQFSKFIDA